MARSGRNAPCPCGSGRKYKLCCLERAVEERQRARTTDAVWERLQEWTIADHAEHLNAAIDDLCGDDRSMSPEMVELLCSYAHLDRDLPGGGTPAERFREHPGLSDLEREARVCAAQLLRFWPPSRHTPPSFFTFEGDEVAHAHARWELDADADAAVLERHPDLLDMGITDDGEGVCLEWTAPRRELAALQRALPARAVLLESTPMFVDADGACASADGGRIGLGTFELRPRSLTFDAISAQRLDGAIALVADALGDRARLLERHIEPLELDDSPPQQSGNASEGNDPSIPAGIREAVLAGYARDRFLRMLDEPDPRFDGLTPREAARSTGQRSGLERWLQTLENSAAHGRAANGMAPDIAMIRRELAIPDDAVADAA